MPSTKRGPTKRTGALAASLSFGTKRRTTPSRASSLASFKSAYTFAIQHDGWFPVWASLKRIASLTAVNSSVAKSGSEGQSATELIRPPPAKLRISAPLGNRAHGAQAGSEHEVLTRSPKGRLRLVTWAELKAMYAQAEPPLEPPSSS